MADNTSYKLSPSDFWQLSKERLLFDQFPQGLSLVQEIFGSLKKKTIATYSEISWEGICPAQGNNSIPFHSSQTQVSQAQAGKPRNSTTGGGF